MQSVISNEYLTVNKQLQRKYQSRSYRVNVEKVAQRLAATQPVFSSNIKTTHSRSQQSGAQSSVKTLYAASRLAQEGAATDLDSLLGQDITIPDSNDTEPNIDNIETIRNLSRQVKMMKRSGQQKQIDLLQRGFQLGGLAVFGGLAFGGIYFAYTAQLVNPLGAGFTVLLILKDVYDVIDTGGSWSAVGKRLLTSSLARGATMIPVQGFILKGTGYIGELLKPAVGTDPNMVQWLWSHINVGGILGYFSTTLTVSAGTLALGNVQSILVNIKSEEQLELEMERKMLEEILRQDQELEEATQVIINGIDQQRQEEHFNLLLREAEYAPQNCFNKLCEMALATGKRAFTFTARHKTLMVVLAVSIYFAHKCYNDRDSFIVDMLRHFAGGTFSYWFEQAKAIAMPLYVMPWVQAKLYKSLMVPHRIDKILAYLNVPNTAIGQLPVIKDLRKKLIWLSGKHIEWNLTVRAAMTHLFSAASVTMAMDTLNLTLSQKGMDFILTAITPKSYIDIFRNMNIATKLVVNERDFSALTLDKILNGFAGRTIKIDVGTKIQDAKSTQYTVNQILDDGFSYSIGSISNDGNVIFKIVSLDEMAQYYIVDDKYGLAPITSLSLLDDVLQSSELVKTVAKILEQQQDQSSQVRDFNVLVQEYIKANPDARAQLARATKAFQNSEIIKQQLTENLKVIDNTYAEMKTYISKVTKLADQWSITNTAITKPRVDSTGFVDNMYTVFASMFGNGQETIVQVAPKIKALDNKMKALVPTLELLVPYLNKNDVALLRDKILDLTLDVKLDIKDVIKTMDRPLTDVTRWKAFAEQKEQHRKVLENNFEDLYKFVQGKVGNITQFNLKDNEKKLFKYKFIANESLKNADNLVATITSNIYTAITGRNLFSNKVGGQAPIELLENNNLVMKTVQDDIVRLQGLLSRASGFMQGSILDDNALAPLKTLQYPVASDVGVGTMLRLNGTNEVTFTVDSIGTDGLSFSLTPNFTNQTITGQKIIGLEELANNYRIVTDQNDPALDVPVNIDGVLVSQFLKSPFGRNVIDEYKHVEDLYQHLVDKISRNSSLKQYLMDTMKSYDTIAKQIQRAQLVAGKLEQAQVSLDLQQKLWQPLEKAYKDGKQFDALDAGEAKAVLQKILPEIPYDHLLPNQKEIIEQMHTNLHKTTNYIKYAVKSDQFTQGYTPKLLVKDFNQYIANVQPTAIPKNTLEDLAIQLNNLIKSSLLNVLQNSRAIREGVDELNNIERDIKDSIKLIGLETMKTIDTYNANDGNFNILVDADKITKAMADIRQMLDVQNTKANQILLGSVPALAPRPSNAPPQQSMNQSNMYMRQQMSKNMQLQQQQKFIQHPQSLSLSEKQSLERLQQSIKQHGNSLAIWAKQELDHDSFKLLQSLMNAFQLFGSHMNPEALSGEAMANLRDLLAKHDQHIKNMEELFKKIDATGAARCLYGVYSYDKDMKRAVGSGDPEEYESCFQSSVLPAITKGLYGYGGVTNLGKAAMTYGTGASHLLGHTAGRAATDFVSKRVGAFASSTISTTLGSSISTLFGKGVTGPVSYGAGLLRLAGSGIVSASLGQMDILDEVVRNENVPLEQRVRAAATRLFVMLNTSGKIDTQSTMFGPIRHKALNSIVYSDFYSLRDVLMATTDATLNNPTFRDALLSIASPDRGNIGKMLDSIKMLYGVLGDNDVLNTILYGAKDSSEVRTEYDRLMQLYKIYEPNYYLTPGMNPFFWSKIFADGVYSAVSRPTDFAWNLATSYVPWKFDYVQK